MIDATIAFFFAHAPSIALVGFFAGFLLIVALIVRPSSRAEMDEHARIPLKENE